MKVPYLQLVSKSSTTNIFMNVKLPVTNPPVEQNISQVAWVINSHVSIKKGDQT